MTNHKISVENLGAIRSIKKFEVKNRGGLNSF